MPTLYVLRGPDKGRTFQTPNEPVLVGRQSRHIALSDHAASREHALLKPEGDVWVIEDLHSSNGTYVNGEIIHSPTALTHGDQIKVGSTLLVFSDDDSVERFSGPSMTRNVVEYASPGDAGKRVGSSILSAIPSCEDSVILARPETADAVHAWKLMYQIAEAVGTFEDVPGLLERVTDLICEHFVFDHVLILMGDAENPEFYPQVVRCRAEKKGEPPRVTASRTIIDHVHKTKHGILCADAMNDQRFANGDKTDSIHGLGLHSVLCVPIIAHDEVHGIIQLGCAMTQHTYTQEQLRLLAAVGRITGMAMENANLLRSRMQNERLIATGETVAYLSHHIRNILQGLHGGSDVLELGIRRKDLETITSAWKIIQRNLERTLRLASNLLTFSKERQPNLEMVQLGIVVQEVIALAQRPAADKGVTLVTDGPDLPALLLDKEGLHQVLLNLVLNAIEACPMTGGRVVVGFSGDADHEAVRITVSDNGRGIPKHELPCLFEPFRSTKGHGGTGLGLAAARKIVRECKGEIEVESAPGQGATFKITIPVGQTRVLDSGKTVAPR